MPQITVTLDSDVLRGVERLEKGKKSKFVNAAVRYLMQNICWDRLDFMRLAMHHAWDELHDAKEYEMAQLHPDQAKLGSDEE